jgi:hypothetical protein
MAYYFDHQDEIDSEIRAEWEQAQRERGKGQRSPFYVRMRSKEAGTTSLEDYRRSLD